MSGNPIQEIGNQEKDNPVAQEDQASQKAGPAGRLRKSPKWKVPHRLNKEGEATRTTTTTAPPAPPKPGRGRGRKGQGKSSWEIGD